MICADTIPGTLQPSDWEALWAPYDEATYDAALDFVQSRDVVLDIGAGDLRFALRAAGRARKVVAVERNRAPLQALPREMPGNLSVVCADALTWPFPEGITVGVLLMRHCRHFQDYVKRLRAVGCRRLITNARWGMAVECVSLEPQTPYWAAPPGWYACSCGAVGFKAAPAEELTADALAATLSVEDCPACVSARTALSLHRWSRR
jgi:hypothetical protein